MYFHTGRLFQAGEQGLGSGAEIGFRQLMLTKYLPLIGDDEGYFEGWHLAFDFCRCCPVQPPF